MIFLKKKKDTSKEYEEYRKNKPYKRVYQINYDKKQKKPIFGELTYDFFAEHIGWEWMFEFAREQKTISIAVGKFYEFGIYDWNKGDFKNQDAWTWQLFDTTEELLENGRIDGKTLKEIWEDLEN